MPKQLCRPPLLRARRAQALRQAAAVNPADLQEPTPVVRKSWCKDDFRVLRTVGTGFMGCVRVVKLRSSADRTPFALKIMRKREAIKLKQVEHVMSERQVLSTIKHPFIVELVTSFQDDACLFMLMEYVNGGELFTYLRRVRRLAVDAARFYTSEIVLALEYLHGLDVVYRDLKPENVLVDCKGHTKLTDFGFAKVVKQDTWTLCGTPEYLAPEIISTKGHGLAVDWWALGVLVFEMLVGTAPFTGSDTAEIYRRVVREEVRYPDHVGEDSVDLISRLMEKEKAKRLGNLAGGSDDVKSHVWFAAVDWDEMLQKRCAPPMIPAVRSPSDTCMFERYPTDDEGDNVPISEEEQELFKGFSTS